MRSLLLFVLVLLVVQHFFHCVPVDADNQAHVRDKLNSTRDRVTFILDSLLKGYDKSVRPGSTLQQPTLITSNLNIRSMGPISELHMDYSLDLYFRQLWQDPRLRYDNFNMSHNMPRGLVLSTRMLDNIWKPDTYFINGKGSYLHTLTTPNQLIRLYPNGEILYSMRLTVKASCPMHLRHFPMDEQNCPLMFGSYGYPSSDIQYRWRLVNGGVENSPVVIASNVTLSQFNLTSSPHVRRLFRVTRRGNFSVLCVYFHLERHTGFFIIQVYVPCTLLVVLSWVSFWINREATADRVSLGITTVLTLTTLCQDSRQDLPRVGYATALDHYIFTCYTFLIASVVEFACVHHFTKFGFGEPAIQSDDDDDDGDGDGDEDADAGDNNKRNEKLRIENKACHEFSNISKSTLLEHQERNDKEGRSSAPKRRTRRAAALICLQQLLKCVKGPRTQQQCSTAAKINSVSKIDQFSKIFFPASFLVINALYWLTYLRRGLVVASKMDFDSLCSQFPS